MRRSVLSVAAIAVVLPALPAFSAQAAPPPVPAAATPAAPPAVEPTLTTLELGDAVAPRTKAAPTSERAAGAEVSVSRPSGLAFSSVGVTWSAAFGTGDVRVQLRTRSGAGAWSAWTTLDASDNDADPGARTGATRRGGTDPVWTGPATGIEAKVAPAAGAPPRDVRLTLIDPGSSPADAAPLAAPATTAAAGTLPRPAIYTRAQWGADPELMTWDPEYAPSIKAGFLHHTAGTNSYTAAEVPAILRSIYVFHARTRGWGDIGYNFLVDKFGRVWEGRAGGMDSAVVAAHAGGFNRYTFGVSMMGTYETTAVPAAVTAAVSSVFAWKFSRWGIDPYATTTLTSSGGGTSKYAAGTVVRKNTVSGHRDVGNTSCPGAKGYATLATIRSQVRTKLGATPTPTPTPPPPTPSVPTLVSPKVAPTTVAYAATSGPLITATLTGSTAWRATISSDCPGGVVRTLTGTGSTVNARWDLRDTDGERVRPGTYTLRLAPTAAGTGTAFTARITVSAPTGTAATPTGVLPAPGPAGYVPLAPYRVLDTRAGGGLPLGGGRRVDVPVLGRAGVPASGVSAVVVSATGLCPSIGTAVTVWPTGTAKPAISTQTANPGGTANLALVRVGVGGKISAAGNVGSVDLALDVVGYLPTVGGAAYHPLPASRVWDVTMGPGETRTVDVPGLPAGATAMLANVAVVGPTASGHVRVWPAGQPRPSAASLSYVAGPAASDRVAVGVDAAGRVSVHNDSTGTARVVLDLSGWYGGAAGLRFTAVTPSRISAGALPAGQEVAVPVRGRAGVPANATAVVASMSGRSSARTWFVGWPSGARPGTADLHAEPNTWEATLAVFPLGPDGAVRLYNNAGAGSAVLDVVGYYR